MAFESERAAPDPTVTDCADATPASNSVDFVDVDDIDAGTGNQIGLGPNSVQGSNTPGWFGPVFLPAMGLLGLAVLALLLLWGGGRALAARRGNLATL